MRLFVATDVPSALRDALAEVGKELAPVTDSVRWARAASMHLTLRFLGEVASDRVDALDRSLAAVRHGPFKVSISGVGFFPSEKAPRVLWAGVESAGLESLAGAVEQAVVAVGFPAERRRFSPHLTLGRSRRDGRIDRALVRETARYGGRRFGEFTTDSFHLYESRLEPTGAVYTRLRSYALET